MQIKEAFQVLYSSSWNSTVKNPTLVYNFVANELSYSDLGYEDLLYNEHVYNEHVYNEHNI